MNCPRPNAIATLITTHDFLPGAQTLLYSLKSNLPSEPYSQDYYAPELIVLVTPNISPSVREALCPAFCTRIVEVNPLLTASEKSDEENGSAAAAAAAAETTNSSHVSSWDKCGYTKLHIFRQKVYGKILYIDSDCLVQKDVSHLFDIDCESSSAKSSTSTTSSSCQKTCGLIAAAPDIFPPDKFNAGVMLIVPSETLFDDMLIASKSTISYDGGDTGFLNAYFDDWYTYPNERRLGFQYNAQRFMYQCTHEKQPKYWDIGVGATSIIHYSSSPKPWQTECSLEDDAVPNANNNFLSEEETKKMARVAESKALDKLWMRWYKKSKVFKENFDEEQKLQMNRKVTKKIKTEQNKGGGRGKPISSQKKSLEIHYQVSKRYKELRKSGVGPREAMATARREHGMDKDDKVSAGSKVAAMFGMPL